MIKFRSSTRNLCQRRFVAWRILPGRARAWGSWSRLIFLAVLNVLKRHPSPYRFVDAHRWQLTSGWSCTICHHGARIAIDIVERRDQCRRFFQRPSARNLLGRRCCRVEPDKDWLNSIFDRHEHRVVPRPGKRLNPNAGRRRPLPTPAACKPKKGISSPTDPMDRRHPPIPRQPRLAQTQHPT